ncbi:MAG: DUF1987 domain-containing protein [Bacteroidales bacterium]|nr:DUF1987 domain-containing protein [Bacteroidales bacterium]
MENLFIEATSTTPKIEFYPNKNLFEISGSSRPEDVRIFYQPILNKLEQFRAEITNKEYDYNDNPFVFNFKFNYFNSSSAKFILDILIEINNYFIDEINIQVNWFFDDGDDDMKEVGEELTEMLDIQPQYIMIVK